MCITSITATQHFAKAKYNKIHLKEWTMIWSDERCHRPTLLLKCPDAFMDVGVVVTVDWLVARERASKGPMTFLQLAQILKLRHWFTRLSFNAFVRGDTFGIWGWIWYLQKLEYLVLSVGEKNMTLALFLLIQYQSVIITLWWTDGQTDGHRYCSNTGIATVICCRLHSSVA